MSNKIKEHVTYVAPVWQRFTAYLMSCLMLLQICLPATVQAVELISDSFIESDVNSNSQFERVYNNNRQFEKAFYIEDAIGTNTQTIELFHQKLLAFRKSALHSPQMIPIINNGITIIIPNYPLGKRIGDQYVQARFVRSQIFNLLNRNLLNDSYSTEVEQINDLYNQAYQFSATSSAKFGDKITRAQVNSFGHNFIWPETRLVNNEAVLVPVVHLTDATVAELLVDSHRVEFSGAEAKFNTITVNAGTIYTRRGTFISTAGNFTVNEGASVVAKGDLNLLVGGTLQNLSGRFSAKDNVNIIANQYQQKTMVHRYATKYEQGTRLGQIASVDASNGRVSIRSYGDIVVQGGTISGQNIVLNADGNIQLATQYTTYVHNQAVGGYDTSQSIIEHTATKLSARDSIYLMASGAIELNAATLTADNGVIQILAEQGIYIANEFNEFQSSRSGKVGKVTLQEQEFQTIAIRSALEAGKGVMIASDFGDITLQATKIKSGDGAQINALNGKVNLLLAKEQDHYFYNRVKKGFWRIKTETKTDTVDTAVYNSIVGGIKIQATHGVTLEFGQEEGVTLQDSLAMFEQTDDLAWMADLYNDPQLSANIELIYQELVELHKHDKSSSLSPAAMAIIAIAMAVVMGPGVGLLGANGAIGAVGIISAPVMQAGALALATQTATSLANGNNLAETVKLMHSSDTVRTVATAMVTAGAIHAIGEVKLFDMPSSVNASTDLISAQSAIDLANQATQIVVETTVSTGISTVINGGSLGDFREQFVQGLAMSSMDKIGEVLAKDIGEAVNKGSINEAVRYLAHASLGCAIGLGVASVSKGQDSGVSCASGAGGAVIGEVIADQYKSQQDYDAKVKILEKTLKEFGISVDAFENLTDAQKVQVLRNKSSIDTIQKIKATGIDLAKLGAGLAAFIAGGEVNIAANAGENAAENNGFWFVIQAAYMLYKAYEVYQTIEGIIELGEKLKAAPDEATRMKILADQAAMMGLEIIIGKTTGKVLEEILDFARKTGLGKDIINEISYLIKKADEGQLGSYTAGAGQGNKLDAFPETGTKKMGDAADTTNVPTVTSGGHLNACKIRDSACAIEVDSSLQGKIDYFVENSDRMTKAEKGAYVEDLVDQVAKADASIQMIPAKYGSNNGIDHLFIVKKGDGTTLTLVIDSKQISATGSVSLATGSGGHKQLTDDWIDSVLTKFPVNDPARIAILNARRTGTLVKAVTAINKDSNQLWFIPVKYDGN
ncbi:DUF637 domain-containing protein [Shewanella sp. SM21]|uniref:DUF637 domain-containing protein n=1 Tax=Shewanella sp. SM21 TaxID=2912793 RepID=UPI0021DA7E41|nr:DUF637 domain-containing protein [Shewanella sp. SM21]MCU8089778.1 DUF637 domain-containing protein [Shewanella sp. SM21]